MLGCPANGERPAARDHQHDRRPGCVHGLEQLLLDSGQVEHGPAGGLATHVSGLAQREHRHVGLARECYRLGEAGGGGVEDPGAFRVSHIDAAALLQPREESDGVLRIAVGRPGAERRRAIVADRTDHGNRASLGPERQQIAAVLEQHDRLARHATSERAMLGGEQHRLLALGRRSVVRIIEQAEHGLRAQDAAHRAVDGRDGNAPRAQQGREGVEIDLAHHVHVDPGVERQPARLARRPGDAVRHELGDRGPIAHHETGKLPFATEQRGHEPAVGGARNAGDLVERRHDAAGAGVHPGTVGREIDLPQRPVRHVHGVVIAPAFGIAIAAEMFHGREHRVGRPEVAALETAHLRGGHGGAQVGVLPRAFGDASPARVARDVHHRGEGPVHAGRGCLARRDVRHALGRRGVPAGGHRERDRKGGAVAVNHVIAEEQRDVQPRLRDGDALRVAGGGGAGDVQEPSHLSFADHLHLRRAGPGVDRRQIQLAHLLLERHPGKQGVDQTIDG